MDPVLWIQIIPWTLYFGYRVYPGPCTLDTECMLTDYDITWTLLHPPGPLAEGVTPGLQHAAAALHLVMSGDVSLAHLLPPHGGDVASHGLTEYHSVILSHGSSDRTYHGFLQLFLHFTSWKYFTFTEVNIVIFLEIFSQFYPGAGQLVMSLSVSITSLRLSLKYQTRLQSRAVTWYHKLSPAQTSLSS